MQTLIFILLEYGSLRHIPIAYRPMNYACCRGKRSHAQKMKSDKKLVKNCNKIYSKNVCIPCMLRPFLMMSWIFLPIKVVSESNRKCYFEICRRIQVLSTSMIITVVSLTVYLIYEHSQLCLYGNKLYCFIMTSHQIYFSIGVCIGLSACYYLKVRLEHLNDWLRVAKTCEELKIILNYDKKLRKSIKWYFLGAILGSLWGFSFVIITTTVNKDYFDIPKLLIYILSAISNHIQIQTITLMFIEQRMVKKIYTVLQCDLEKTLHVQHGMTVYLEQRLVNANKIVTRVWKNYSTMSKYLSKDITYWIVSIGALMILNVFLMVKDWDRSGRIISMVVIRTTFIISVVTITLFKSEHSAHSVSNGKNIKIFLLTIIVSDTCRLCK